MKTKSRTVRDSQVYIKTAMAGLGLCCICMALEMPALGQVPPTPPRPAAPSDRPADLNDIMRAVNPELFNAVRDGDIAKMRGLIEKGADVNLTNQHGQTALMFAGGFGQTNAVALLLAKGAALNAVDRKGKTALAFAVQKGQQAVVMQLLQAGAKADIKDKGGQTALIHAAQAGHTGVLGTLFDHKADLNIQDSSGMTALMWAALGGHEAAVRFLIGKGANAQLQSAARRTAKDYATAPVIVELLKKAESGEGGGAKQPVPTPEKGGVK